MKRKLLVVVLLGTLLIGMVSCMNNIPCPAYANVKAKPQDNRS